LEKWRGDEVDILARVREQSHHAEGGEGGHGAAVVISGESGCGCVEGGGDIGVGAEGGEGWVACVI